MIITKSYIVFVCACLLACLQRSNWYCCLVYVRQCYVALLFSTCNNKLLCYIRIVFNINVTKLCCLIKILLWIEWGGACNNSSSRLKHSDANGTGRRSMLTIFLYRIKRKFENLLIFFFHPQKNTILSIFAWFVHFHQYPSNLSG